MSRTQHTRSCRWLLQWLGIGLCLSLASPSWAVPSFARQTGMTCAACHTVFPELTPFGREFKLNGYVLDNIKQVTGIDTSNRSTLALNALAPISLMAQISYTHTSTALPDSAIKGALAKDGDLLFPQQVSLFYAGKIADELGAFIQLTYDGVGDSFGFDNTDIRYAHHLSFGGANSNNHTMILGVTLNNNPTVQDTLEQHPRVGISLLRQRCRADGNHLGEDRQRRRGLWPERRRPRCVRVAGRSLLRRGHHVHLRHSGRRSPSRQHR